MDPSKGLRIQAFEFNRWESEVRDLMSDGHVSQSPQISQIITDIDRFTAAGIEGQRRLFLEDPILETQWKATLGALERVIPDLEPEDLPAAMTSLARLRNAQYDHLISSLSHQTNMCLKSGKKFSTEATVDLLWAFARLGRRPPGSLYRSARGLFTSDVFKHASEKNPEIIGRLLWTLGVFVNRKVDHPTVILGHDRESFLLTASQALASALRLPLPPLSPSTLTDIAWGAAALNLRLPLPIKVEIFDTLINTPTLSPYDLSRLSWAAGRFNLTIIQHPPSPPRKSHSRGGGRIPGLAAQRRRGRLVESRGGSLGIRKENPRIRTENPGIRTENPGIPPALVVARITRAKSPQAAIGALIHGGSQGLESPVALVAVLSRVAKLLQEPEIQEHRSSWHVSLHDVVQRLRTKLDHLGSREIATVLWALSRIGIRAAGSQGKLGSDDVPVFVGSQGRLGSEETLRARGELFAELCGRLDQGIYAELAPRGLSMTLWAISKRPVEFGDPTTPRPLILKIVRRLEGLVDDTMLGDPMGKSRDSRGIGDSGVSETGGDSMERAGDSTGTRETRGGFSVEGERLSAHHLKTVLESMARLSMFAPDRCSRAFAKLSAEELSPTMFHPRALMETMRTLSRGRPHPEAWARLREHAIMNISEFSPKELSTLIWLLAIGSPNKMERGKDFDKILTAVERTAKQGNLKGQDLSMILYGLAQISTSKQQENWIGESVWEALKTCAEGLADDLEPQGLSNSLWAFARLRRLPPPEFLQAVPKHAHKLFKLHLSNSAWALAKIYRHCLLRDDDSAATRVKIALSELISRAAPAIRELEPHALCNVLWAMAQVNPSFDDVKDENLNPYHAIQACAERQMDVLGPRDVTTIIWAYQRMEVQIDPRILRKLRMRTTQISRKLKAHDVALQLWAIGAGSTESIDISGDYANVLVVRTAEVAYEMTALDIMMALRGLVALSNNALPEHSQTPSPSNDQVDSPETLETAETVEADETLETLETAEAVEADETVETLETLETVKAAGILETVKAAGIGEMSVTAETVGAAESVSVTGLGETDGKWDVDGEGWRRIMRAETLQALELAVLRVAKERQIQTRELATIIWCFAVLDYMPHAETVCAIEDVGVDHLERFNTQDVVLLLWGLARLGLRGNRKLVQGLSAKARMLFIPGAPTKAKETRKMVMWALSELETREIGSKKMNSEGNR